MDLLHMLRPISQMLFGGFVTLRELVFCGQMLFVSIRKTGMSVQRKSS